MISQCCVKAYFFLLILLVQAAVGAEEPQSVTKLEPNQVFERELVKESSHQFSLSLSAGEYASLRVEPRGTIVFVTVHDKDRKLIMEAAQPFHQPLSVSIPFVSEKGGAYRITVRNGSTRLTGSCRIRLEEPKIPGADDLRRAVVFRAYYDAQKKVDEPNDPAVYRQVIESGLELLPQWRAWGDRQMESATLYIIAEAHEYLGEEEAAMKGFQRTEALIRGIDDRPGLAAVLIRQGWLHGGMGEVSRCEAVLAEAIAIAQSNANLVHETRALEALATLYSHVGDRQRCIETNLLLIKLHRRVGDDKRESRELNDLGVEYRRLGNQEQAAEYFRQALEKSRAAKNTEIEALSLANLGQVSVTQGRLSPALENAQQALEIATSAKYRYGQGIAINVLGQVFHLSRQYEKAEEHFKQALAIMREIRNRDGQLKALLNLGRTCRVMGKRAESLAYLDEMLAMTRNFGFRPEECYALYEMALVERDLGRLDSAARRIEAALDLVESLRDRAVMQDLRDHFLSPVQEIYESYIALQMARHRQDPGAGFATRALETSERARARGLIEMLNEAKADFRQGVDPALLDREREVRRKISAKAQRLITLSDKMARPEQVEALKKEIAALGGEAREIEARVRASNPRYANLQRPRPLKLEEIQREALDDRTLLLEYSLGEEKSWLWAVTTTGLTSRELPKRGEIEDLARRVNELMRARPGAGAEAVKAGQEYESAARRLSDLILRPIADQLRGRRLLVVADGALRYIPFAALPTPGATEAFTPMIVNHEINTVPSATTLATLRGELKDREAAPRTLAVLADPVFGIYDDRVPALARNGKPAASPAPAGLTLAELERGIREDGKGLLLPRLPFTRAEADAIAGLIPQAESLKALDFQASRELALSAALAQHRILHLATHGLINSQHPELSGLFFSMIDARGQARNGLLRVDEIYHLTLPVELVTLSACETALGKEIKGEGIAGLTRGFMYAGARRVLASLWKVNDASTAELMKRFYQGMLGEKKLSPAAALREAQVSMWKEKRWQAPYYWAGFVLQGEW